VTARDQVLDRLAGGAFVVEQNGWRAQVGQVAIDQHDRIARSYQSRQVVIRDTG
jgi:hypothetical protein